MKDVVIIGAGLTGLTVAFLTKKLGKDILVLEKEPRTGGAIQTHSENGYLFEEGPNTGVVSNPEVAELFEMLGHPIEEAKSEAEKRLILKNNTWHPLPNGPISFMRTPLFSSSDKIKIMFEPLRKKGSNPEESVAELATRRIGQSFVDYAINPFISGIYAGDPEKLTTKYALPKLYNLEQNYGSFIGGAIKKSREKKTDREKKASKKVFSATGGLSQLTSKMHTQIGNENITCNASNIIVSKCDTHYSVKYQINGKDININAKHVISTIGSHAIESTFPFIDKTDMAAITNLTYAKVIQASVALRENALDSKYISFGGLIPKKEKKNLLGVLFPSYCFDNRAPQNCSMLAVYLGGIRRPDLFDLTDKQITELVTNELSELFSIKTEDIRFIKIFRHPYAIPQYEQSSGRRFETIRKIESEYPGLIIAGNVRDGIGMADRIKQAFTVIQQIDKSKY